MEGTCPFVCRQIIQGTILIISLKKQFLALPASMLPLKLLINVHVLYTWVKTGILEACCTVHVGGGQPTKIPESMRCAYFIEH